CKRIALEERIMFKRIHAAITILLAIGMVVTIMFAVRAVARERAMAAQEQMLAETARQEAEKARKQLEATERAAHGVAARAGFVYLDGDVLRRGVYALQGLGQLTLRRLIAAAGGVKNSTDYAVIVYGIENNRNITRLDAKNFSAEPEKDLNVVADDRVIVI